ncbi:MAG: RidA family protein [Anaerovoracaceae bacterium]|jgi:2-iminobutanoate/2-iminopropanoate deaminase
MKKAIATEGAPKAVGAYSQGVQAEGLIFVSGQIPLDPATGEMAEDIGDQARQSMENIKAILEAAGSEMNKIVKTTILLADINDFAAVNAVYESYFRAPYPARACYAVAGIPKGAKLEIEAIATKG